MSVDRAVDMASMTRGKKSWWGRLSDRVLSIDPRRRTRLSMWLISVLVYMACILIFWLGMLQGWLQASRLLSWCGFIVISQAGVYVLLRSGWSERFADPALTSVQIVIGVIGVEWGYLIFGPIRSVALFPLLLIFTFGAFSLSWRQIMWLTVFALISLVGAVAALNFAMSGVDAWSLANNDLRLDLSNVLMIMIMLPALSFVAAQLSSLRHKLHAQRAALTTALAEVQRLATHDELTGLANRRYILERLTQEQNRFKRFTHPFSIAIIDLDHFKRINDSQGHAGGDQVLRAFAAEAIATLRTSDLIARWGGEEFLVLLPDTRGPQALASMKRLLVRVRGLPHGTGPLLTFSAGVTEYRADEPVMETVVRADHEMYEAKNAGRNTALLGELTGAAEPVARAARDSPGGGMKFRADSDDRKF